MSLSGEAWKRDLQGTPIWEPEGFPTVELGTCGSGGKDTGKQSGLIIKFGAMSREAAGAVLSQMNMGLGASDKWERRGRAGAADGGRRESWQSTQYL